MKYIKAFMFLTIAFCFLAASGFFLEATSAVNESRMFIAEAEKRLVYTDQNVNAFLVQLGLVTDNIRRATEAQKSVTTQTLHILKHTDRLLTQTQTSVSDVAAHSVRAMDSLEPPLASLDKTLQSLNVIVADQNIPRTLANLEQTSKSTSLAAAHIAGTTDDVEKIAHHYEVEITKPVSTLRRLGGYALTGLKAVLLFK